MLQKGTNWWNIGWSWAFVALLGRLRYLTRIILAVYRWFLLCWAGLWVRAILTSLTSSCEMFPPLSAPASHWSQFTAPTKNPPIKGGEDLPLTLCGLDFFLITESLLFCHFFTTFICSATAPSMPVTAPQWQEKQLFQCQTQRVEDFSSLHVPVDLQQRREYDKELAVVVSPVPPYSALRCPVAAVGY